MKLSSLKTDADKRENGAWVGDIPEMGDARLKVRSIQCSAYKTLFSELIANVPRAKRHKGRVIASEMERITSICLHRTILLDWDGFQDDDGNPQPYDKALAEKYLTDPDFQNFKEAVNYAAAIVADNKGEATEAVVGNSVTSSNGSLPGEAASSTSNS